MMKTRAYVTVKGKGAELGWFGNPKGSGRIVEIVFQGGQGKLGTLQISSARIRWKSAGESRWHWMSVSRLPMVFAETRTLKKK